jgi:hypothetical protein
LGKKFMSAAGDLAVPEIADLLVFLMGVGEK